MSIRCQFMGHEDQLNDTDGLFYGLWQCRHCGGFAPDEMQSPAALEHSQKMWRHFGERMALVAWSADLASDAMRQYAEVTDNALRAFADWIRR